MSDDRNTQITDSPLLLAIEEAHRYQEYLTRDMTRYTPGVREIYWAVTGNAVSPTTQDLQSMSRMSLEADTALEAEQLEAARRYQDRINGAAQARAYSTGALASAPLEGVSYGRMDEPEEPEEIKPDLEPIDETNEEKAMNKTYQLPPKGVPVTIPHLKQDFSKLFGRLSFQDESEIRFGISYLEKMVGLTSMRVADFDATPFMSEETGFLRNKAAINKRLFEVRQKAGINDDTEREVRRINEKVLKVMKDGGRYSSRSAADIRGWQTTIQDYEKSIQGLAIRIARAEKERSSIVTGTNSFYSPLWDLNEGDIGTSYVEWTTKNSVTLTEVDPAQGINRSFVIGKIRVRFKPRAESNFYAVRGPTNIDWDSCWHPHIHGENICLGNANIHIQRALADNDFTKALELLYTILTSYNKESPFIGLDTLCLRALERGEGSRVTGMTPPVSVAPPPEEPEDEEPEDADEYYDDIPDTGEEDGE